MPLPRLQPMLAANRIDRVVGEWAVEPKLDGWRALVYIDDKVTVRTRTGRDVSENIPGLQSLRELNQTMILDGELVADAGRASDFYRVAPTLSSRGRRGSVSFAIFDVLCLDDELLTDRPYRDRRGCLRDLSLHGPSWCTLPSFDTDLRDVFEACAELELEGIVAKRIDGRYEPGKRSSNWLKIKTSDWRVEHGPRRHNN